MIAIISNNKSFLEHIKPLKEEYTIISNDEEVLDIYEMIIIEDNAFIKQTIFTKTKTLVLSTEPAFNDAMELLQLGIRGYGNSYMSLTHLTQAITTIKNEAIWLQPNIMNSLIAHGSKISSPQSSQHLNFLSDREKEVALEIQEGKSNKEIAISLGITERTVKAHLSHIFEKLDVHDRLALAMLLRA